MKITIASVNGMSIAEEAEGIRDGEWLVPTVEGGLKKLSISEANKLLAAYESINDLEFDPRISLNSVNFYLYTKSNPTEGKEITASKQSIDASNFNSTNPTRYLMTDYINNISLTCRNLPRRITIHGWNSNYKDGVNTKVRDAWFLYGDYNMIAVDWARGRSLDYASSVAAVSATGAKIANLVEFLVQVYGMSLRTLEIVGFSLGAHVAGLAAKQVTISKVQKVVGLDPAMPLMSYDKPDKRLSSNDAVYVESIQTCGGILGYTQPIGRAAFYPNGGKTQPGCGVDPSGSCAHTRAVSYYVESLRMNNFPTVRCPSYQAANSKDCGSTYCAVRMGSPDNIHIAYGEFYVPVNKASPYGLGDANDTTTPVPEQTTVNPEDGNTTLNPFDSTTTSEIASSTSTISPTTIEPVPTTSTPGSIVTSPPNDDDNGKGHQTNIYILNLIYVKSQINKN